MLVRRATVTGWGRRATRSDPAAFRKPGDAETGLPGRFSDLLLHALRRGMATVIPAVLVSLLFNVFVAQAMTIRGPSMVPSLTYAQQVLVEKITYRFGGSPSRGDVVVVDRPDESVLLVKRVVALAGETVAVQGGRVYVDGELLAERWATLQGGMDYPATRVPLDHIFVLGDNRRVSRDSRFFGAVPVRQISGRVRFSIWPFEWFGQIP